MKILSIIAEYNPLHTGHAYHIDAARRALCPDAVAVVTSGNFTQRGDVAVVEKHIRAQWAIRAGADIVLELPAFYAVNCAERFADGALKTLSCFNAPTVISFGSESGNIQSLAALSEKTHAETEADKLKIKRSLADGKTLVRARADALDADGDFTPNNVLALEYLHFAKKYGFECHTIKREGCYTGGDINGKYASANAIRDYVFSGNIDKIRKFLPNYTQATLKNCISNDALTDMLLYKLNSMKTQDIAQLFEVSEGLENRIKNAAKTSTAYAELCDNIKSKRYTMARIKRILLYALFNLTKDTANDLYETPPYARVLAVRENRPDLLSALSENGNLIVKSRDLQNMPDKVKDAIEFENLVDGVYSAAAKSPAVFNAVFVK